MKLAIMQPYIFPYIGYYQLLAAVDKFVVYDDVNYINRGWINRNNVLVNGQASLFTIPLNGASQNMLINEVKLANDNKWRGKILKTIELSYKKAPFFKDVFVLIDEVLSAEQTHIHQLALLSLQTVATYLELKVNIEPTSAIYNNRNLSGQARILDTCKQEKAEHYINAIGGMQIYTPALFEQEGIKINFIKPGSIEYVQFNYPFVPHLSIIDVLMFNSKETVETMLNNYTLL